MPTSNLLIHGDNLVELRSFADQVFDLVYLDPPFNSNSDYELRQSSTNRVNQTHTQAFGDTWVWGDQAAGALRQAVAAGPTGTAKMLDAFYCALGDSDIMAYLAMMAPRLIELYRVLKPTGTLFLHCDQSASHYLKLLLDSVFGRENFLNHLVWRYRRWPARSRAFQRMHDDILFYVRDRRSAYVWNQLFEPLSPGTIRTHGHAKQRAVFKDGWRVNSEDTQERSPGTPMTDVWQISIINPRAKERTDYPTQKPEALLERIIGATTIEGDIVLDPFCGCGTTIAVAEKLGRRWVGIDSSPEAITIAEGRLQQAARSSRKHEESGHNHQ